MCRMEDLSKEFKQFAKDIKQGLGNVQQGLGDVQKDVREVQTDVKRLKERRAEEEPSRLVANQGRMIMITVILNSNLVLSNCLAM